MNFKERILQYTVNFSENDYYIAKFIFENPKCYEWSINEFSKKCLVSKTGVIRFCQKINLSGYAQLKAILKWENHKEETSNDLSCLVKSNYEKMLQSILNVDMTAIFEDIYNAKRIILYGSGVRQSRVINEWKRIFLPTQKTMITINDEELLESFPHVIRQDDFAIIVSLSGEKEKVIEIANYLKIMRIKTLCVTRMQQNRLAQICNHSLYINSIQVPKEYAIEYEIVTPYYILIEVIYILYQNHITSVHNSKR